MGAERSRLMLMATAAPASLLPTPALQNLIFRFLQSRQKIQIWLFEQTDMRIEGRIIVSAAGVQEGRVESAKQQAVPGCPCAVSHELCMRRWMPSLSAGL